MSITIKRTSQLTTKMHYLTAEMRFIKSDCAIFSDASKLVGVGRYFTPKVPKSYWRRPQYHNGVKKALKIPLKIVTASY